MWADSFLIVIKSIIMKNLFFLILATLSLSIVSCSDDEPELTTVNWTLDESNQEDNRTINSGENESMTLELRSNGLCPAYGVRVTVSFLNAILYDELIENFDTTIDIQVSQNSDITITTSIDDIPGSQILCIQLGSVDATLTY